MTQRKIKIDGREVVVFKMDVPESGRTKSRGRAKSFERLLIEALKPGEATDILTTDTKRIYKIVDNVKKAVGKTYATRKEGKGIRVYCTGKAKSNVLQLRRTQIAA